MGIQTIESKYHYQILDGLRGVAALMVILYHVFEGFATSPIDQHINHGYLAVDFFFILSGFVISYAYDDRWDRMGTGAFFRRRLIRLHPMVIAGAVLGAATFLIQGSVRWDGSRVPSGPVMLAMLLGMCMIPASPGGLYEVRGNGEMFPLNGPNWSLFFEYIGNIVYALVLRRLSTRWMKVLAVVLGAGLAAYAIGNVSGSGHLGVGWTLADHGFAGGMLRMMFSYTMGMVVARTFRPRRIRGAFWICSASLALLLSIPHVGGTEHMWVNGIYDSLCIILVFPVLIYIGACGSCCHSSDRACKFLGDLSYPLYMVHYPFYYLFYAWVWKNEVPFCRAWPVAAVLVVSCVLLACAFMKFYDAPVRRRLSSRV